MHQQTGPAPRRIQSPQPGQRERKGQRNMKSNKKSRAWAKQNVDNTMTSRAPQNKQRPQTKNFATILASNDEGSPNW